MKKKTIRYSAFLIAAILAIGSFSIWAMNTQATADATVDVGTAPAGLNVNGMSADLIVDGTQGRPGSVEENEDLFTVQQQDEDYYSGQYEVTVYLANADELVDHFRYLNINLTAENADSDVAEEGIGYITLENGRVSFAVEDGDVLDGDMTVSIAGGSYLATSNTVPDAEFLIDISEGSTQQSVNFVTT